MTAKQCEQIKTMRLENYSYAFIGNALNLSPNTVKSVCQRQGFVAEGPRKTKDEKKNARLCKNCHTVLPKNSRANALFCSDACRTEWQNNNRRVVVKAPKNSPNPQ